MSLRRITLALARTGFLIRVPLAAAFLSAAGCADRAPSVTEPPDSEPHATGAFSLKSEGPVTWLVRPDGRPFFSLGVCVVDQGTPREAYRSEAPAYASWRVSPHPQAWAAQVVDQLKGWGFTTLGGWCDARTLLPHWGPNAVVTPVLAAGMEAGAPWLDLWDSAVLTRISNLAHERLARLEGDPRVLGYYSDNELGWWNGALLRHTLSQAPTSTQRQSLVDVLASEYSDDWSRLEQDFDPEGVASFEDLRRGGNLYLRPGGQGIHVARKFLGIVAERYYEVLGRHIRGAAPKSLFLGDRYQSFYYREVARAAARHVDIVSTNLNAQWRDGTFLRFYLETLREITGKPVLISEFYMAATENRSGCPCSKGVFPLTTTQRDRARAARRSLEEILAIPWVVGADWFQYYDEPPGGRFDGEDHNFGLVDIEGLPYEELTEAFRALAPAEVRRLHRKRQDALTGIPPAPPEPLAGFAPGEALISWDRERGFVPATSPEPLADLYICWSRSALYLAVYTLDPVDEAFYRGGVVPEADRMSWSIHVAGGRGDLSLRLGAGRPVNGAPRGVKTASMSGRSVNVRCVAALELPAELLGRDHLAPGDVVSLDVELLTMARAERISWAHSLRCAPGSRE